MKKAINKIFEVLQFILMGKGKIANKAVDDGLVDLSGQGRDAYGN